MGRTIKRIFLLCFFCMCYNQKCNSCIVWKKIEREKINGRKWTLIQELKKFAKCFPNGVIGFEKITSAEAATKGSGYEGHAGEDKAVVVDPFKDTVSRECLRHDEFKDKVKLGRVRDHFIFNIESTGQFPSDTLFLESVKVLKLKCVRLKRDLNKLVQWRLSHLFCC